MNTSSIGRLAVALLACALATLTSAAHAHDGKDHQRTSKPSAHAPIGVMGDHMHEKGEWMFSYRFMHMQMEGNRAGTSSLSPTSIATTTPNPFFGAPGQPPTLRVVPTEMTMDMHMLGAMYAPANWITLMAMTNYTLKDMQHTTFLGGMGTNIKGTFTTRSEGFGDTTLAALVRVHEKGVHHIHLNLGISLPTGSITEDDLVLPPPPPAGLTLLRLPYAMQLGSGTYDFLPGVTYTGYSGAISWGAQGSATIRIDKNDEGYALGDAARATGWVSYDFLPTLSTSFRLSAETLDSISGRDARIMAPVQTADPANYGGDQINAALGLNLIMPAGPLAGHRLSTELSAPLYRDLNGPQLETDWTITVGWQKAF